VSIATVSRVLNGSTTVSQEMRNRVISSIKELNYTPSALAKGLAVGKSSMLGILVPDLSNPVFPMIIKSISDSAKADNYHLIVTDSNGDSTTELGLVKKLLTLVDGLILISPRMSKEDIKVIPTLIKPVIVLNRNEIGVGITSVCFDNLFIMSEVCGLLLSLGHRNVAYLMGPEDSWQQAERMRAVENSAKYGLKTEFYSAGGSIKSGYDALDQALLSKPTAIICFNDLIAIGVVARAKELGIKIPEEISLTGFDDIEFASFSSPQLTTVRNPNKKLGEIGWQMIHNELIGASQNLQPVLVAQLIERESTGPVRS
jgi:LacI family transcriptional regulator